MQNSNKFAFTLAEVLITLGIIGVVAALTLPSLIQSYKKQEASARLKKFSSIFNQMMILAEEENGPSSEWERTGDIKDENGNLDWNANFSEQKRFFEKYFAKHIKYIKIEDGTTENDKTTGENVPKNHVTIFFGDGSNAHFYNGGAFSFVYDINGIKPPNEGGRDQFVWDIWPSTTTDRYSSGRNYGTRRRYSDKDKMSRNQYLEYCKSDNIYCTRLLELDNWEFKKDYPYRI